MASILSVKPGEIPDWPLAHYGLGEDGSMLLSTPGTDLERLLVTCGYGHLHVVQVQTQPPPSGRVLGRNVIIQEQQQNKTDAAQRGPARDEDGGDSNNDTSLSSSTPRGEADENEKPGTQQELIHCKVSVAPIISSASAGVCSLVNQDGEEKVEKMLKRPRSQFVSHFVIQFEPKDERGESGLSSSTSSYHKPNAATAPGVPDCLSSGAQQHQHNGSTSESSQPLAAVA